MFMAKLGELSDSNKKLLAIGGIFTVLGSWLVVPLLGKKIYDIPPLDTAFLLTIFWTGVWSINVLRKRYIRF